MCCTWTLYETIKISMRALGGIGNLRVSTHFFNTEEDIDHLIELQKSIFQAD